MAAVAPAAEQANDLLQKLSLDPKNKTNDGPDAVKKNSGVVATKNVVSPYDKSLTPLLQEYSDGSMCYLPSGYPSTYYYGGYDGALGEWGEDYPRYVNQEGVEMPPGFYGDVYHAGYGYAPYGPYHSPGSPVPTLGHDGQLYGPQHYQFPAPYYQPNPTSTPFTNQAPSSKNDICTSAAADHPPVSVDSTKSNANTVTKGNLNGFNDSTKAKLNQQNLPLNSNDTFGRVLPCGLPSSGYQDPRFGFEGTWTPVPWFEGHMFPDGQQKPASTNSGSSSARVNNTTGKNQNLSPHSQVMGFHAPRPTSGMGITGPGILNRGYGSNQIYGQNANALKGGFSFGSNAFDSRMNGRWGMPLDNKYKTRGRGNGHYSFSNENLDGLSELNRGPRAGRFRNEKSFGQIVTIAVKGDPVPAVGSVQDSSVVPDRDQYNQPDFPDTYSDAKFFVIKSYSEDDIHKSIKYNVWASTPNGNKKLDAAYQEAKEKAVRCPVFLFFSVNTSGQFVGVAEMTGPVDFNKTVEYWQQDKWTGCFPLKWHIVKDVPNSILKHITLENNDNKPVTNSRDTQEVKLEQGLQVLKLFKEHVNRTSILDDFSFYETRHKVMQEKRSKQQQFHKKTVDADEKDKDGSGAKSRLHVPLEDVTALNNPAHGGLREIVLAENGVVTVAEKRVLANRAA